MMKIKEIEKCFEENVPKKKLQEVSLDKSNSVPLIDSKKEVFDFDVINTTIKTSDTVYFKDNRIIFVEFKRGKIKNIDFRLKATESIISFYNYIFQEGFTDKICFPSDVFQIYFVYNRDSSPAAKNTFSSVEKELKNEYKHLFSKFRVIDSLRFIQIFKV